LHESLFNDGEEVVGTSHPKIMMAVRRPLPRGFLKQELEKIGCALLSSDVETAVRLAHGVARVEARHVEDASTPDEVAAVAADAAEAGLVEADAATVESGVAPAAGG
jgi:hypothetical protein